MVYFWILLGCYAIAFVLISLKLHQQSAQMKEHLIQRNLPAEEFKALLRQQMPLVNEILIRLWSPFVLCIIPTLILSLVYFLLS